MNRVIALSVFLLFFSVEAGAGEIIIKGESLNLERCIEIGLKTHPNIIAAKNTVNAYKSRVSQAEAGYYPQIDLSAGYSRVYSGTQGQAGSMDSVAGASSAGGSYNQYSGAVTIKQTIYDFGKTGAQVGIQTQNLNASRADLETTFEQIIFNVKQTYYGLLKARRNREVADETVRQFQSHLEQAKGFYEVGTKPKFDVTKAEVDLSNARLNLIKAENALKLAIVSLNNAMGVPDAPEYLIVDNLPFSKYAISFSEAVEKAYKNRPELQSLTAKRIAAEQSIELAKKGYYPALAGNAAYGRAGTGFPLSESWNAGITLSFPLFSGFLTKNQIEEARANLKVLQANEEALRQSIFLEVQQAFLNLTQAEDSIATAELTVRQATENLEIAQGRYAAGVGNPIEVTDAEVLLVNAKTSHIQSLYDYKIGIATIEKAVGIR